MTVCRGTRSQGVARWVARGGAPGKVSGNRLGGLLARDSIQRGRGRAESGGQWGKVFPMPSPRQGVPFLGHPGRVGPES